MFLYYLLRNYVGTVSYIVRSTQGKLDKLEGKMSETFHWNVDKFTTCVSALLVTLVENGSKDRLVLDKVYES